MWKGAARLHVGVGVLVRDVCGAVAVCPFLLHHNVLPVYSILHGVRNKSCNPSFYWSSLDRSAWIPHDTNRQLLAGTRFWKASNAAEHMINASCMQDWLLVSKRGRGRGLTGGYSYDNAGASGGIGLS